MVECSAEEVLLRKARAQTISGPEGAWENSPVLSEAMHRVSAKMRSHPEGGAGAVRSRAARITIRQLLSCALSGRHPSYTVSLGSALRGLGLFSLSP